VAYPSGCGSWFFYFDTILLSVLLSGGRCVEFVSQIQTESGKYFKETKIMIKMKIKEAIAMALVLITFGLIMTYFYQILH